MQIIERTRVFNGHYKVNQLIVQDGDAQLKREQFAPGKAVAALVYDTARQVYVLTRQFRIGPEKEILELAAGMIDHDEAPETAVRREIHEELGYEIDRLEEIVQMWPSPGTSSEAITIYYAEVSHKTGAGGGLIEENEKIEMVDFTWDALVAEPLQDAKTMIAVQWAQLRKR
ncbi:NUDIX domain-containing protein [Hymenobacter properus]|uniref:GDP-mannose pyrophosphatase n=1 Tax=Hymenobacter properus TaxID=2791026 RepID=A0A931FJV4_9BACT|nr:NUDIX hydrolase [Hymenobacter properus]MBF9140386.1 NUDIX hydrolase [Hymenobacter properus]MBR7719193.1 NUDIX hydrolase [Microvirga sp. SRT04]